MEAMTEISFGGARVFYQTWGQGHPLVVLHSSWTKLTLRFSNHRAHAVGCECHLWGFSMRLPISCFIVAQNEAHRIIPTIRAVRDWVDEVIVVDSGSTDGTQALACAEGANVVHNAWLGFGQQKRFAEDLCRNDWLLNVDADELVTSELAAEIRSLFSDGTPTAAAYNVRVTTIYPGWQRPRYWGRDHDCLRLYDRKRARFRNSAIYDSVVVDNGMVGHLQGRIYHRSFTSLAELKGKCNVRASYQALHAGRRPLWKLAVRLVTEFPVCFWKYYIGRGHCTGGVMGAKVSAIFAYYRWVRVVRICRLRGVSSRAARAAWTPRSSA